MTANRIPTLAEFEALPLATREALFIAWIKGEPPERAYTYVDNEVCPLAQFGALIQRVSTCAAGAFSFRDMATKRHVRVCEEHSKTANRLFTHTTFGDLAASLS